MFIVIVGMGQVGQHLLKTLELDSHDLVAVDISAEAIRYVEEHHDVMTLRGYGASQHTLQKARVEQADLVVAVTDKDEVNLIAALAAKQMGAKRVIARVQSNAWSGRGTDVDGVNYGLLGVDVVFNPRVLLAKEIAKIAQSHGALEVLELANDRIEVVQMEMPDHGSVLHKTLSKLRLPSQVLVGAVVRDQELFIPGGADVLLPGDRIYLVGTPSQMVEAEDLFSHQKEAQSICIVGGGVIGKTLAASMRRAGADVLLIESDGTRAHELAESLPGVTVLHGDGTDLALLNQEKIARFDLFVSVTSEDEVNLMAGLISMRAGGPRTVALVHRPDYADIYRQLGIDVVLSPRAVASAHILRFCRQTSLQSLTVLEDGKAEVLEIVAPAQARLVGVPMRRLSIPRGALIAAILREERVTVPHGEDHIQAGDTVVVLCIPEARAAVARMFRERVL